MLPMIDSRNDALIEMCRRHRVQRLSVFGSAAGDRFDPETSDLDFLVEFQLLPPKEHADSYFGLLEELEETFRIPVDLIEAGPIRNPYFKQTVDETRITLYEIR